MTGEQGGRVIKKIIQTLLLIPRGGRAGNVGGGVSYYSGGLSQVRPADGDGAIDTAVTCLHLNTATMTNK